MASTNKPMPKRTAVAAAESTGIKRQNTSTKKTNATMKGDPRASKAGRMFMEKGKLRG